MLLQESASCLTSEEPITSDFRSYYTEKRHPGGRKEGNKDVLCGDEQTADSHSPQTGSQSIAEGMGLVPLPSAPASVGSVSDLEKGFANMASELAEWAESVARRGRG